MTLPNRAALVRADSTQTPRETLSTAGSVVGRSAAMSADYGDFDQGVKSVAATPARGGA